MTRLLLLVVNYVKLHLTVLSVGQLILDVGESTSHVGKMTGNQLSELLIVISPKDANKIKQLKLSRLFKFVITLVIL